MTEVVLIKGSSQTVRADYVNDAGDPDLIGGNHTFVVKEFDVGSALVSKSVTNLASGSAPLFVVSPSDIAAVKAGTYLGQFSVVNNGATYKSDRFYVRIEEGVA
jgi:hypothetical protein